MDKLHLNIRIPCSRHPSEFIQRVSTDVNASQHLFCLECILTQTQDDPSLSSTLKNVSDLVDMAAQFYARHKDTVAITSDAPDEYVGLLSKQAETLEALSTHIATEKKKIESEFDTIIHDVLQRLTDKKNDHLHKLDQQLANLRYWYISFAKQVKKTYPTPEDIPHLYPSRDDLITKAQKITNDTQLAAFVRSLKEDINEPAKLASNERLTLSEIRKKELSELAKQLSQLEQVRPVYGLQDYSRHELMDKLEEDLDKMLQNTFELKNSIEDISSSLSGIDSKIVNSEQASQLKSWLDPKYRSRQLKLLYRGKKDGMNANTFHAKCDNKGPTITLLKCESTKKSGENLIVGGFADQAWNSVGNWTASKEAFLFSLTTKVKCTMLPGNEQHGICGTPTYGPVFGAGNDLSVMPGFETVNMNPGSYSNSAKLYDRTNNSQTNSWKLLEIEVYSLDK